MSELVPEGWDIHRQGDVANFSNGRAYKLTEWETEGTPVIRLQNLTGSGKEYYYSNLELPERQYCYSGDLLYMWSATFGPHIWQGGKAIYHYHIWKVTCDEINLTKYFLYQLLGYKTVEWLNKSNGMGILHVTKGGMEDLSLVLPPLPEQQKIATILSSVDNLIEQIKAQINKLQDLKKGIIQELLSPQEGSRQSEGFGHTEFKDSPVGRIPKGWSSPALGDLIGSMDGGVSVNGDNKPKATGEYGVLKVSSVYQGEFLPHENKVIIAEDLPRAKINPQKGKILFSRANTPALVGESGYVEKTRNDLFLPDKIWQINLKDETEVNMRWLSYILSHGVTRKAISDVATGTSASMKNISKPGLLSIRTAMPSKPEQDKIASSIYSLDLKLRTCKINLSKSRDLKKALVQDLLTGKVRVTPNVA